MKHFQETSRGWLFCVASERAVEFANGDDNLLAEACFARMLSERNIDLDWCPSNEADEWPGHPTFKVGCWNIGLSLIYDEAELIQTSKYETTFGVLISTYSGSLPLVTFFGCNSTDPEFPHKHTVSTKEWLRAVTPKGAT